MPELPTPDHVRLEVHLPAQVAAALQHARDAGESTSAAALRLLARSLHVQVERPRRGRPPKEQ